MENTMKHFMMLFCLALSPLSFAYGDDSSGDGTNTGSKSSGGGYGSGSGGSAAALLAVGAIVYYMRRGNDDESGDEAGIWICKKASKKVNLIFPLVTITTLKMILQITHMTLGSSSNKFQLNLTYKFN